MKTICQLVSSNRNDPPNSPRYYRGSTAAEHQGKFPNINLNEITEYVMIIKTELVIHEDPAIRHLMLTDLIHDMIGLWPYFENQRYPNVYIVDEDQLAMLILTFT